ncbi:flagellin [Propionivibrio sp.]|uniref:flagellin N-terminal helical domain-containing protein n=1 Tax=Propionivibrio sp. TaxID=2212460 RepID=UPI003BEFBADC
MSTSVVNTNVSSINAQKNLAKSSSGLTTALQRLSSGLRINSAKDDAAGMSISSRMSAQLTGNTQAARNANDAISLTQTAESGLSSISTSLQRIRELTVQSANSTNTGIDREAMQAEVSQLLADIQTVSTNTAFNGRALLDGSLTNQQFQVGANAGQTISVSINSASTKALGSSATAAITTAQNAGNTGTGLTEGAFALNGTLIGPSEAAKDTASTALQANSSIARAAAVNAKSTLSGVTATINATEVAGSSMTAAALSGSITINNVAISLNTTTNTASTRASVVTAINAKKDQTGVTAVDTGTDKGGIQLVAADGRNIITTLTDVTSGSTGLVGTSNNTGSITLNSDKAITITSNKNGAAGQGGIKDSGLTVGTFSNQTAYASSTSYVAPTTNGALAFAAGDFTINGAQTAASLATSDSASYSYTTSGGIDSKSASGISKAAAINSLTNQTGVSAKVQATVVQGDTAMGTATSGTGTLNINGVTTALAVGAVSNAANRASTVIAINNITGQTGVVATDTLDDAQGVTLSAADGRNITVFADWGSGVTAKLTAHNTGLGGLVTLAASGAVTAGEKDTGTMISSITLSSATAFTIGAGSSTTATTNALNLKVGTYGAGRSGMELSKVDISTVDGANKALTAIDNALASVTSSSANMGAIQNRFASVVSNLASTNENLAASRSRIMDADFATETAALTRGQILQQAGTAMLAQANSLPQGVLSLLK